MEKEILKYLEDNYVGLERVDLNPIIKPIESKDKITEINKVFDSLEKKGFISIKHEHKIETKDRSYRYSEYKWGAIILSAGLDYLSRKRQESFSTNSAIGSVFIAALAFIISAYSLIREIIKDSKPQKIEVDLKQPLQLSDSGLKIIQMRLDSLARAKKVNEKSYDPSHSK